MQGAVGRVEGKRQKAKGKRQKEEIIVIIIIMLMIIMTITLTTIRLIATYLVVETFWFRASELPSYPPQREPGPASSVQIRSDQISRRVL